MAIPPHILARIAVHIVSDKRIRQAIIGIIAVLLGVVLFIASTPFIIFSALIQDDEGNYRSLDSHVSYWYDSFIRSIEFKMEEDKELYETVEMIVIDSESNYPIDNTPDVLTIYAVEHYRNVDVTPVLDEDELKDLRDLYNEMNTIEEVIIEEVEIIEVEVENEEGEKEVEYEEIIKLHKKLYITNITAFDVLHKYNDEERRIISEMLSVAYVSMGNGYDVDFVSNADIEKIKDEMPENLDYIRKKVVDVSLSLVGKVPYFWGGKYNNVGENPNWGVPTIVSSAGSKTTGTTRPLGLDCSGYVTWAFINAGFDKSSIGNVIGHGTYAQRNLSISISKSEALPGDLAFIGGYGHVGIVVGYDDAGDLLIAHENSSDNNVDVDSANSVGFIIFRRPYIFD